MELLKTLYVIHAPSYHEWPMITFVWEYVNEYIPEAEMRMDEWGNLYITKGKDESGFPTLVCHLDQVQTLHSEDFKVREEDRILFGWSEQNQRREGLGADDKNGIWVSLRCLEQCPRLKVFMAVGEEKGCIGSNRADMSFFKDSLYVLEPDCKGDEEIHINLKGIPCASEDFVNALQSEDNGYTITDGKGSDIFALTLNGIGVSCANIPAGYHLPHKDEEYTVVTELEHCLEFVLHVIQTLQQPFPHFFKTDTQLKVEEFRKKIDDDNKTMITERDLKQKMGEIKKSWCFF